MYRENAYKGDVEPATPKMMSFELPEAMVLKYREAKNHVEGLDDAVASTESELSRARKVYQDDRRRADEWRPPADATPAEGQAYMEKIWDDVGAHHVAVLRLERRLNELSEQAASARHALSKLRENLEAVAIAAVLA